MEGEDRRSHGFLWAEVKLREARQERFTERRGWGARMTDSEKGER